MPDGQRILSGSDGGTVRVWLLDGTLENTFELHTDWVRALVALPDNQHALSGSCDATVKLFNVNDGAVLRTFKHHGVSLALLPDGLRFVSGSNDKTAASPTTASRRAAVDVRSLIPSARRGRAHRAHAVAVLSLHTRGARPPASRGPLLRQQMLRAASRTAREHGARRCCHATILRRHPTTWAWRTARTRPARRLRRRGQDKSLLPGKYEASATPDGAATFGRRRLGRLGTPRASLARARRRSPPPSRRRAAARRLASIIDGRRARWR